MLIEYLVSFGKGGTKVTHRVIKDGSQDSGGGDGSGGPDGGGGDGSGGPDGGGGDGSGGPDGGGGDGSGGPDGGGGDGSGGPDGGGGAAASGCGCPSVIVMGPTVISGHGGSAGHCGSTFKCQPIPKTYVIPPLEGVAVGDGGPVSELTLEFQQQTFWCWAAVGLGTWDLISTGPDREQCVIAGEVTSTSNVCTNPAKANHPESMKLTLAVLGRLGRAELGGVADFKLIQQVVNSNGKPMVARIAWDTYLNGCEEGAHFVLIAGWKLIGNLPYLQILDPAGPDGGVGEAKPIFVAYETFRDAYRGSGKWVATYLLKGAA